MRLILCCILILQVSDLLMGDGEARGSGLNYPEDPVTFPNSKPKDSAKPASTQKPSSADNLDEDPEDTEAAAVAEAFEKYAIVPQIIPRPPKQLYKISSSSNTNNTLGKKVYSYPSNVYLQPRKYYEADPEKLYTVIYFNADINFALEGTFDLVTVALLVVNVPGNDLLAGDQLAPYAIFLPIPGYGPQRNIALVYQQPEKIEVTLELRIRVSTNTTQFKLVEFVECYDLGDPIAGNFFLSSLSVSSCDNPAIC